MRAECQIHQQRVVIRRSRLGAELDEASAEQLVHLRRAEVLRHGCADDGAVIVVIPGNTRVGVYLRGVVNRGHIERGKPIDLKRVYEDDQQACAGDGENQHRAGQKCPSFSFHHEYRALRS